MQNQNGEWILDPSLLENMATSFYQDLYTNDTNDEPFILQNSFPVLDDNDLRILQHPVSDQEIKQAIFDMGSFKAPRGDGLQAIFYQSQ